MRPHHGQYTLFYVYCSRDGDNLRIIYLVFLAKLWRAFFKSVYLTVQYRFRSSDGKNGACVRHTRMTDRGATVTRGLMGSNVTPGPRHLSREGGGGLTDKWRPLIV